MGIDTVDFIIYTDVAKRIKELVPDGLDVAIDAATFHEPKTVMHKISKALSLETDASETLNETFLAVKKMGRVGIIAAYAGYTNGLNIGAVMEKGIRLIGNGQGKSAYERNRMITETTESSFSSRSSVLERDPQGLHHPWKVRPEVHDHPSGSARGYGRVVSSVR